MFDGLEGMESECNSGPPDNESLNVTDNGNDYMHSWNTLNDNEIFMNQFYS